MDCVLADSIDEELWFGEDDPAHADRAASESLAASVARISGLKPLPVVVQKVLAELARPEWSAHEVSEMVASDPSLASMVLRLANSSFYSRGVPLSSVPHAITRLGGGKLRELVVGVAAMSLVDGHTRRALALRDHCAGTAAVARELAVLVRADSSVAFLAGLLHDMGRLLMLETGEIDYETIAEANAVSDEALPAAERYQLDFDHAVLGGHVLKVWGIPEPVPQVVAWHHQPVRAYEAENDEITTLVGVLRVADRMCECFEADEPIDARALAKGADGATIGLRASTILGAIDRIGEARSEALALFAG